MPYESVDEILTVFLFWLNGTFVVLSTLIMALPAALMKASCAEDATLEDTKMASPLVRLSTGGGSGKGVAQREGCYVSRERGK